MKITDLFVPFADELQLSPTARLTVPPLIEWASGFGDLFFRLKDADPEIVWCVLGRSVPAKRPLTSRKSDSLERFASGAFRNNRQLRVVPFKDGTDWALINHQRLLIKSPLYKTGAIWKWNAEIEVENSPIEWLSQPLSWFEHWVEQSKDEELNIARTTARLEKKDRVWLALCREKQIRQRWEQLIPALQKLCFNPGGNALLWELIQTSPHNIEVCDQNLTLISSLGKPLHMLLELFSKYFPLHHERKYWRHLNEKGNASIFLSPKTTPLFASNSTSQHERLGAALLWRDFGREIGESERVEAALSELLSATAS